MNPDPLHIPGNQERPPFFSSWRKMYAFVLSFLGGLIILFYAFMKFFS